MFLPESVQESGTEPGPCLTVVQTDAVKKLEGQVLCVFGQSMCRVQALSRKSQTGQEPDLGFISFYTLVSQKNLM